MTCYFAKLDQEALLHLQGPDALTFLQGQVTCDTRSITPAAALPGTSCTAQGRVVADFLLCAPAADHAILRLRREVRAVLAELLSRYIVFSKASVDPERDDWQVLACWGAGAADALHQIFGTLPQEQYGVCVGDGYILVQIDAAGQQYECYLAHDADKDPRPQFEELMEAGTEPQWQVLQIASGIARIEAATTGEFIPQMLNYDVTGHISFSKGCYTGQEVVARMHYRGKPKRRLYLASASGEDLTTRQPAAGDPLYSAGSTQPAGHVINAATARSPDVELLVTATVKGIDEGLTLFDHNGPLLTTVPVPYPIPE